MIIPVISIIIKIIIQYFIALNNISLNRFELFFFSNSDLESKRQAGNNVQLAKKTIRIKIIIASILCLIIFLLIISIRFYFLLVEFQQVLLVVLSEHLFSTT